MLLPTADLLTPSSAAAAVKLPALAAAMKVLMPASGSITAIRCILVDG